jgi:hypothetical protein
MLKLSQQEKAVAFMCRQTRRGHKEWFYAYDFLPPKLPPDCGDLFIGYEINSRLGEVRQLYPQMFENKKDGKYIIMKLKIATVNEWFSSLPKNIKQVVARELDYYPHMPDNRYNPGTTKIPGGQVVVNETQITTPEQGKLL